jgi:hypothetical protein
MLIMFVEPRAVRHTLRRGAWGLGVALASFVTVGSAAATLLIFEPAGENFQALDQAYGDRVAATHQDGFIYGGAGGFTPNVTAAYGPIPPALPALWTVGYGDLLNVLFENKDAWGILEIKLAADLGWLVNLSGFDMAAWRDVGPIRSLRVMNAEGDLLFDEADVAIPFSGHVSFAFDPPLVGRSLTIRFDSGNLGSHSDDIGIDNIKFGQQQSPTSVEPETWAGTKSLYR